MSKLDDALAREAADGPVAKQIADALAEKQAFAELVHHVEDAVKTYGVPLAKAGLALAVQAAVAGLEKKYGG